MGAGASAGVDLAIRTASVNDISCFVYKLPAAQRARVFNALSDDLFEDKLDIVIRRMGGDIVATYTCAPSASVLSLRRTFAKDFKIPLSMFSFCLGDGVMTDTFTLKQNGVSFDHHVFVMYETGLSMQRSLPKFRGIYKGEESEHTSLGDHVIFELCIDSIEFSEDLDNEDVLRIPASGIFHWRCLLNENDPEMVGTSAKEFVRGTVRKSDQQIDVQGHRIEYRGDSSCIAMATYIMKLSDDGSSIRCSYDDLGFTSIDEPFVLRQCSDEESLEWRLTRESHERLGSSVKSLDRGDFAVTVYKIAGLSPGPQPPSYTYLVSILWDDAVDSVHSSEQPPLRDESGIRETCNWGSLGYVMRIKRAYGEPLIKIHVQRKLAEGNCETVGMAAINLEPGCNFIRLIQLVDNAGDLTGADLDLGVREVTY